MKEFFRNFLNWSHFFCYFSALKELLKERQLEILIFPWAAIRSSGAAESSETLQSESPHWSHFGSKVVNWIDLFHSALVSIDAGEVRVSVYARLHFLSPSKCFLGWMFNLIKDFSSPIHGRWRDSIRNCSGMETGLKLEKKSNWRSFVECRSGAIHDWISLYAVHLLTERVQNRSWCCWTRIVFQELEVYIIISFKIGFSSPTGWWSLLHQLNSSPYLANGRVGSTNCCLACPSMLSSGSTYHTHTLLHQAALSRYVAEQLN